MSQEGILGLQSSPSVPTSFVTDAGTATPAANTLNILGGTDIHTAGAGNTITISFTGAVGTTITGNSGGPLAPVAGNWNIFGTSVAAGSTPVTTSGVGNTLTVDVQKAQGIIATDATKIGLAAFNSAEFTVDANGFVSLIGGGVAVDSVMVQAATAPGTNPVPPTAAGLLTINGAAVTAHSIPLQSNSIAANTLQLEVQYASSAAGSVATNAGVASFFNQQFTVDSNGFVTQANGLPVSSIGVQAHTAPGTSPVVPTAGGLVTINGTIVAAHSIPIQTDSLAANTLNVEVQRAAATAATDTTSQGMASFNSAQFTVDANGFVALVGGGAAIETITGNSGGPEVPSAGNFNILGTGSITVAGSANTETVQLTGLTNHSLLVGAGTATITNLGVATNGQLPIGSAGADPVLATLTAGTGVTITNGAGSITIAAPGGGLTWVDVTGTSQTVAVNHGYLSDNAGTVAFTLPASATQFDIFRIVGVQGAWTLAQAAGQQIKIGSGATTVGVTGSLASTNAGDSIECIATNTSASTIWRVMSSIGNITVA